MKYTSWVAKTQAKGRAWDEKHIRTVRAKTQVHAQPSSYPYYDVEMLEK